MMYLFSSFEKYRLYVQALQDGTSQRLRKVLCLLVQGLS